MSPPPTTTPVAKSKHRLFIGILLGVVALGGIVSFLTSDSAPRRKAAPRQEIITITLPPPPPPPKIEPPKVEPPPDDQKEEIAEEEPVDLTPPDAPVEAPSEALGTNITGGNGPDMGLSRGGGNGTPGGRRGGLGGTNIFARYSLSAKATIEQALRRDPATRSAIAEGLKIEFWPDAQGRITRAEIIGGSAGSSLTQAIKRVLLGLQTQPAANPKEMPPSVKIRITARKPAI